MAHDVTVHGNARCAIWCCSRPSDDGQPEHGRQPLSCKKKVGIIAFAILGQAGLWTTVYKVTGTHPFSCDFRPNYVYPPCIWPQYFPSWMVTEKPTNEAETPDDADVFDVYPEVPPVDTRLSGSNREI